MPFYLENLNLKNLKRKKCSSAFNPLLTKVRKTLQRSQIQKMTTESNFAKLISYLLHPLLMPTVAVFLIFNLNTYLSYTIPEDAQLLIYSLTAINTAIIPLLVSFILLKYGSLQSILMESREERRFPFIIAIFFYYFSYHLMKQNHLPSVVVSLMLGATVSLLITALINFRWKISVHMVGIGGLAGALIMIGIKLNTDVIHLLLPVLFAAGLIGFARLRLNAHSPGQVYAGFLTGSATMAMVVGFEAG